MLETLHDTLTYKTLTLVLLELELELLELDVDCTISAKCFTD